MIARRSICAAMVFALSALPAFGQATTPRPGFALAGGTEYGFGLLGFGGGAQTRLEIGAGISPLWFSPMIADSVVSNYVYLPYAIGAKVIIPFNEFGAGRTIKVGATYNSLVKLGIGGGIDFPVSPRFRVSGGAMVYPQAQKELVKRFNRDHGTSYADSSIYSPLTRFQPFFGLAYLFR
jgi:hypothetical protein